MNPGGRGLGGEGSQIRGWVLSHLRFERCVEGQVIWGSLRAQHEGRWVLGKSFLRTCSWFWGFTTAALGRRRVTEALGDLAHLQGSVAGQHRGSSAPSALPPPGTEAGLAAGQAPAQCLC